MQQRLIFDSIIDALGEIVRACGGPKAVGAKMRPELPVEQAAGWVRDNLNATRREHFTPMRGDETLGGGGRSVLFSRA